MNKILISILVPIYKVEKYIQKCIISLFEQSYTNIEYIFVDDCSPDNSINILNTLIEQYPQRKEYVKIIHHESNKGLAEARNTALINSSGKYIIHVDSDDYIATNAIELLYNKAIETDADIVSSDYYEIFSNNFNIINNNINNDKSIYLANLLQRKAPVCIWGKLIKRILYSENNIYSIPNLNYGEDYVVLPRLVFYANKVVKVSQPLYCYMQLNQSSYSHNLNKQYVDDAIHANDILIDYFTLQKQEKTLPLNESRAYNIITLLYATPKELYPRVNKELTKINIKRLNISLFHKSILLVASLKLSNLLYLYISIINFLRKNTSGGCN